MVKKIEEEEYEFTQCAEDAIEFFWPREGVNHPFFPRYMIELQLRLIECGRHVMTKPDRVRALKTVKALRAQLADPKGEAKLWA